jgi:hypothetical protein
MAGVYKSQVQAGPLLLHTKTAFRGARSVTTMSDHNEVGIAAYADRFEKRHMPRPAMVSDNVSVPYKRGITVGPCRGYQKA